jgi:hypothetical protein
MQPAIASVFLSIFSIGLVVKETNHKNASDDGAEPLDVSIFSTFSYSYFARVNASVKAA